MTVESHTNPFPLNMHVHKFLNLLSLVLFGIQVVHGRVCNRIYHGFMNIHLFLSSLNLDDSKLGNSPCPLLSVMLLGIENCYLL